MHYLLDICSTAVGKLTKQQFAEVAHTEVHSHDADYSTRVVRRSSTDEVRDTYNENHSERKRSGYIALPFSTLHPALTMAYYTYCMDTAHSNFTGWGGGGGNRQIRFSARDMRLNPDPLLT